MVCGKLMAYVGTSGGDDELIEIHVGDFYVGGSWCWRGCGNNISGLDSPRSRALAAHISVGAEQIFDAVMVE